MRMAPFRGRARDYDGTGDKPHLPCHGPADRTGQDDPKPRTILLELRLDPGELMSGKE